MMWWAIILLLLAAGLFIAEALLPTAGSLGIVAVIVAIAGLGFMFAFDRMAGLITTIIVLIIGPIVFAGFLRIWPRTPVGRALTLTDATPRPNSTPLTASGASLVGETGEVVTPLRPVGICKIGEQRIECMTVGEMLPTGAKVRVVAVSGMTVSVRAV